LYVPQRQDARARGAIAWEAYSTNSLLVLATQAEVAVSSAQLRLDSGS
jgi:hypothetical protein